MKTKNSNKKSDSIISSKKNKTLVGIPSSYSRKKNDIINSKKKKVSVVTAAAKNDRQSVTKSRLSVEKRKNKTPV